MAMELAEAVERTEIGGCGADLVEVLGLVDRLLAKVSVAISEFDRSSEWEIDGYTSAVAWLRSKCRMSGREAASMVRTARRLASLPVTSGAWASGELSRAQVSAVSVNLKDSTVELFAEYEAEVIPMLARCSVAETAGAMKLWAVRAAALADDVDDAEPARSLHISETLDGRRELSGSLDAESGEIVETAIRMASCDDVDGEPLRTPAERRADALTDISRFYLNNLNTDTGGRNRSHVNVVIDFEDFETSGHGQVLEGPVLDSAAIRRMLCDCGVHRVITAGRSTILDYGSTTQAIPASLWAALVIRDHHCRFPGCDRPPRWCEGHHLHHYADGGPTRLSNLAVLCSRHHHLLHRPGWSAELKPDATLVVKTPDGRVLTSSLPNAPPPALAG